MSMLTKVKQRFLGPFQAGTVLKDATVRKIFGHFELILGLNTELFNLMSTEGIATAFKRVGPYFKLYALYAENFENALQVLDAEMKQNGKLASMVYAEAARWVGRSTPFHQHNCVPD